MDQARPVIICITLAISLSCRVVADLASPFPDGFMLQADGVVPKPIEQSELDSPGSIDLKYQPVIYAISGDATTTWRSNGLEPSVEISPLDGLVALKGRSYFAFSSDFGASYFAGVGSTHSYDRMIEVELGETSLQAQLKIHVHPTSLAREADVLSSPDTTGRQKLIYHLFPSRVFAPEILIAHSLLKSEANANFGVLFNAGGGKFTDYKQIWSRRPVLYSYSQPQLVTMAVKSQTPPFIPAESDKGVTYGDSVDPLAARFEVNGLLMRCSPDYGAHLSAEGVRFIIPIGGSNSTYTPKLTQFSRINLNPVADQPK